MYNLLKTKFSLKKFSQVMKISSVLLLMSILNVAATELYSQTTRLSLNIQQATLSEVIDQIENQTEFLFFYSNDDIDRNMKVNVEANNQRLEDVLNHVLSNTNVMYAIKDRHVLLISKKDVVGMAALQGITITGTVTGSYNERLPGVNVVLKGTQQGTVTDANGVYSITVPNTNAVLLFSFVGFNTYEIPVGDRQVIDVMLSEDAQSLEEVVVIGYGIQRKSDITGSVVSVKGSELNTLPTMRPDAALQGRAAGVMIQNTDGAPGGNVYIRIRGGNSISGGNSALVVVDGLQGVDITLINPNDIASLEVLKDASATAIYGARGANGVILITTKRGATGKPIFTYDYSLGFQQLNKKLDIMSAAEYARDRNAYKATLDERESAQITPILPFTDADIRIFERGDPKDCTDWQDALFRTGLTHKHQLTMSGGSDKFKYFISGGYMDQTGILVNTNYQRYNMRSNLDVEFTHWLSAGINVNLMKAAGNVPPVGEGTRYGDVMGQVINTLPRFDPCTPIYDENGNYNFKALQGRVPNSGAYAEVDIWSPMATAMESYNLRNQYRQEANAYLDFKIIDGLTLRISGAASISNEDVERYQSMKTQPGSGTGGLGNSNFSTNQYYQNSNILTYSKIFGNHRLSLTGVAEQQLSLYKDLAVEARGFGSDDTGIRNLASASTINSRTNSYSKRALNSWLGRVNYSFKDRYMLTASVRADGSSVFGADNKWSYFPSVAAAWNIAEEDFLKSVELISLLKIRATWGQTGNQATSPFQTLATVSSQSDWMYPYLGTGSRQVGYRMGRPANPGLKWETTAQTNLGIDLGFFQQRLTLSVDLYKKTTTDLLLDKQMPTFTGFTSALYNVGSVENKGIEITAIATPVITRDFRWTTDFNISMNRDKVLKLADDLPMLIATNTGGGYNFSGAGFNLKQLRVGEPLEQMYGWVCLGTWGAHEEAEALSYNLLPGDAKFLDVLRRDHPEEAIRNNLTQAVDGEQVIGNANPKFYFGWNNQISYKIFNLQFLIQGSYGNDIFNGTRIRLEDSSLGGTSGNLRNRWTINNQNTYVPAYTSDYYRAVEKGVRASTSKMRPSDNRSSRWIEDGSYIRLKYITLSVNVPQSAINSWPIDKLLFYVSATNLMTITNYSGYDPEVSSFNARGTGGLGIDMSNYPTARVYTLGINLTF